MESGFRGFSVDHNHFVELDRVSFVVSPPDLVVLDDLGAITDIQASFVPHLAKLEEAGLVISEKEGRRRLHYFNPVPIQQIYDRWTDRYSSFWSGRLIDVQSRVETRTEQRRQSRKKRA